MPTLDRTIVAGGGERVRYDPPAMTLHWLTALLVLTLWTLAQAWGFLQHGTPLRHELQALHVSLGLVLIVVLALRIGWRAGPSRRLPPAASGAAELAARAMHYLLYALLLAEVALGLGFRWAGPDPLSFFGLFTIPAPAPSSWREIGCARAGSRLPAGHDAADHALLRRPPLPAGGHRPRCAAALST